MFGKPVILVIIFILLLAFYLVIRLGAGKKKDIDNSKSLTRYLFGIRILIIIFILMKLGDNTVNYFFLLRKWFEIRYVQWTFNII